jgi:NAD(P)-dependent dehydrogenase (short-subunit alcohol dehydrogenase family)
MAKRVVLVIGGSKGIGRATAELFYRKGDQVIVAARDAVKLTELERKLPGLVSFIGDMTIEGNVEALFDKVVKQFKRIDVVVLSAAPFMSKPLAGVGDEEWRQSLRYVDIIFRVNRAAARQMLGQKRGGVVLNISSRAGLREDVLPNSSVYSLIKGGMTHLVVAANQETDKVRFIALCPGLVGDTEMGQRAVAERPGLDNGESLQAAEVAETIFALVESASPKTPAVYRLTKEKGLEIISA